MDGEIAEAARILRAGGVVAFPTETVYGLGADARNEEALAKIFAIKGRPKDHPVIVHLASAAQLDDWAVAVPDAARSLAARFWPGPLTLILNRRPDVPPAVAGGQPTIGLRVPDHPVALALLRAFGGGLAAPSANRFGGVSPTRAAHVEAELGAAVDQILDGGECTVGIESTIVDLTGAAPRILRPGGVPREAIEDVLGRPVLVGATSAVRAPGTLPSHYAPRAVVEVVAPEALEDRAAALRASGKRVVRLIEGASGGDTIALPEDEAGRARRLYAALREVDERKYDVALISLSGEGGLAEAIADRVQRAAAPRPAADPDDPRARFSQTVDDYVRYRPDYPEALFDWIAEQAGLRPGDTVVDVGCGTGISSRQLAARGYDVVGVDPNPDMLAAARAAGGAVTYVEGDAESLPIARRSVAAIVGGQAFHWFDLGRALPRLRERLTASGRVVAFWNLRDASVPLMAAYEALLLAWCPEYAAVGAEPRAKEVAAHPGLVDLQTVELEHQQTLDRAGFRGRVWSSSYVRRSVTDPEAFDAALDALFDRHAEDGVIRFAYRTVALSFR